MASPAHAGQPAGSPASVDQKPPRVSVIMSVYNGQDYLHESIQSILDQDFQDFEFIVADDGSVDQTWNILQAFQVKDRRIIPVRLAKNAGTSLALTKALGIARGNYIARQDADDISLPGRLTKQIAFMEQHPEVGLLGCHVLMVDPRGNPIKTAYTLQDNEEIQKTLLDFMCICGPTVVLRRSAFEKAGYYFTEDMSYTEDYDLCLRIGEVSDLHNLPEVLYHYRQHPQSVSYSKRYQQLRNKAIALERAVYRRSAPNNPPPEHLYKVSRDYIRTAVLAYCDGLLPQAKEHLERGLIFYPAILDDVDLVEKIIQKNTPEDSSETAIAFVEAVFKLLFPTSRPLSKLRRRMVARLHMQEVFAALASNDQQRIDQNLWIGIHNHPAWLFNKGVMTTVLKRLPSKLLTK